VRASVDNMYKRICCKSLQYAHRQLKSTKQHFYLQGGPNQYKYFVSHEIDLKQLVLSIPSQIFDGRHGQSNKILDNQTFHITITSWTMIWITVTIIYIIHSQTIFSATDQPDQNNSLVLVTLQTKHIILLGVDNAYKLQNPSGRIELACYMVEG
jgi:hypothetical protein